MERKTLSVSWLLEGTTSWIADRGAPRSHEHHPQFDVSVISLNPDSAAQFSSRISEDFLHSLTLYSPQVVRHNGAAVRQRRRANRPTAAGRFHTLTKDAVWIHVVVRLSLF